MDIADIHLLEMVDFIIENDTKTLFEKYYNLESKFPNIHQRVSLRIIASYLQTSPVHLSIENNSLDLIKVTNNARLGKYYLFEDTAEKMIHYFLNNEKVLK